MWAAGSADAVAFFSRNLAAREKRAVRKLRRVGSDIIPSRFCSARGSVYETPGAQTTRPDHKGPGLVNRQEVLRTPVRRA